MVHHKIMKKRDLRKGLKWKSRNEAKRNEELQRKARPEGGNGGSF